MSKLAALAAKRRQQGNDQSATSSNDPESPASQDYTTSLQKLKISQTRSKTASAKISPGGDEADVKNPSGDSSQTQSSKDSADTITQAPIDISALVESDVRGKPSPFANIIISHEKHGQNPPLSSFTSSEMLPSGFDFTQPSPDDIVTRAQNVKGRN